VGLLKIQTKSGGNDRSREARSTATRLAQASPRVSSTKRVRSAASRAATSLAFPLDRLPNAGGADHVRARSSAQRRRGGGCGPRRVCVRPVSDPRFLISEGLSRAEPEFQGVHREFNGQFESTTLSRDDLSREIGRKCSCFRPRHRLGLTFSRSALQEVGPFLCSFSTRSPTQP